MTVQPFAEAAHRNGPAIRDVLRHELAAADKVLEIGSGTGQHAVLFGAALPHLVWQTSDLEEHHHGINAWLSSARLSNVRAPLVLDVRIAEPLKSSYDAVFSANTAHIMDMSAVKKMFALVSQVLRDDGMFCLYGPFRQSGRFNTVSNERFHRSLKQSDSAMGIRHLEDLDELGATGRLRRRRLYAMPANNHLCVWSKAARETRA
jgi:cyclopropane fatty-acyl-phospholipid synthase-like methyltransferase